MSKQAPRAAKRPVTQHWKAARIADMDRLGISRSDLADKIGVTRASISNLLGPSVKESKLVDLVHAALGLPPPRDDAPPEIAGFVYEMESVAQKLTTDERDLLLELARKNGALT